MQRVHFQVRVGVFNCQQILAKISFVLFDNVIKKKNQIECGLAWRWWNSTDLGLIDMFLINLNAEIVARIQEPITPSVQLPYSVCETAYSHVGLFLDQPFLLQIRSFHFFWILLKVSLTIAKPREKLTKHGFNQKNLAHWEMYQRYATASLAHVESANKTHGNVGRPV